MKSITNNVLIIGFLLLNICSAFGQNPEDDALYAFFDKNVGKKNLGINNGTVHSNAYRSENKSFRYLVDDYRKGSIFYDGQYYPEVYLKYDLYKDVVIAKLDGENNKVGINLIQEKTDYFLLENKKFVNLNSLDIADIKGYYEENIFNEALKLYTRHSKDRIETLQDNGAFSRFEPSESFVLNYNNLWYMVKTESSLTRIFPGLSEQISRFYSVNVSFRNTNPKQFMKDLVKHIDFLLQKP
jgi:hypothetical protein